MTSKIFFIFVLLILATSILAQTNHTNTTRNVTHITNHKITFSQTTFFLNQTYKPIKYQIKNKNCSTKEMISLNVTPNHTFHKEIGCSTTQFPLTFTKIGNQTLCANSICTNITVLDPTSQNCNLSIDLNLNKNIFHNTHKIKFKPLLNTKEFPFTIQYWIEDLFQNTIQKPRNTTNTNQKTFTPKIKNQEQTLILKTQLFPACQDINHTDNYAQHILIIKGNQTPIQNHSEITLLKNKTTKDFLYLTINAYRGNTNKYTIYSKLKKTTKFQIPKKFSNHTLTVPIPLDCHTKGTYPLTISGLDISQTHHVELPGKECPKPKIIEKKVPVKPTQQKKEIKEIKTSFEENIPKTAQPNSTISFTLTMHNSDTTYYAWAYIYRGSKCYSCQPHRDSNRQQLQKHTIFTLPTPNSGNYKVKIKIQKENQKTTKDITKDITILQPKFKEKNQTQKLTSTQKETPTPTTHTTPLNNITRSKLTIYQTKSKQNLRIIPYILPTLLILILLLKRK